MTVDVSNRACCPPRTPAKADAARAERIAGLAKVLSDPIRVQIVDLLASSPEQVCQCDLHPLFAISQPTLSHHLRKLQDAELIDVERRGKWAYYSVRPQSLEVLRAWLS